MLNFVHVKLFTNKSYDQTWNDLNGVVSGDDSVFFYPDYCDGIEAFRQYWTDTDFIRKDIGPDEADRKLLDTSRIDFCSSRFSPVKVTLTKEDKSKYDIIKWMPYRPYDW